MRYRAAVWSFLAISLALLLCVPAAHLWDAKTRALVQAHWSKQAHREWATLLFSADAIEARLAASLWRYGISTDPGSVVVGYDGWLHLGDTFAQSVSATRGDALTPQRRRDAIDAGHSLLAWESWLKAQGVQALVFMLGPNKSSVYPDTVPIWARSGGDDPLDVLAETAPSLVLDLRHSLRAAAAESALPLYYATDTHWNQLGATHAFLALGERLREIDGSLQWPLRAPLNVFRVHQRRGGDLANFLRIPMQTPETEVHLDVGDAANHLSTVSDLSTGEVLLQRKHSRVDFPSRTVLAQNPDALNSKRVLWLKDSFGGTISPMMAAAFDQVVQLHYHSPTARDPAQFARLVTEWRPEWLIITAVERDVLSTFRQWAPPASFPSF